MKMKQKESLAGIAFASPFLVGFALFFIIPFLISIWYTFTFGTGGTAFVGLANYVSVLQSQAFQLAAWNTFRFIVIGVPLIMVVSILFSLLLQYAFAGSSFFRSLFLYPMVLPIASTVMIFQIVFAESGLLNSLLSACGVPIQNWLNSDYAFSVLVFLYVWKNCGYNMVLLLAGLNAIPQDLYESAALEGATGWRAFRYVTLPLIRPTLFFVFVISIINSFKSFREAFLLNGTMPHPSIYMLQHFMNNNFSNLNYQRLSVAALLTFLVIFFCVFLLFRRSKKAGDIQL